jgi:hypothetical protein
MAEENMRFIQCTITGPDGKKRQAWELIVEGRKFGKCETQEQLLSYYKKQTAPLDNASHHWKNRHWLDKYHSIKKNRRLSKKP